MLRMLVSGVVPEDFAFTFTASMLLGYAGVARKTALESIDPLS